MLVIIGLLLGAILKGQELLTGARVRSIIQAHDGIKAAYFGFLDRYRSPPGDYANATANISGIGAACGVAGSPGNGDGDGMIRAPNGEHILAWEHLSKSGFLNGLYVCTGNAVVADGTVPKNAYGQHMQLIYDNNYAGAAPRNQHNLKTGNFTPSDILAEIDRKVDDGSALLGSFRGSTYTNGIATDAACWDANGNWSSQQPSGNCGAATLY